MTIPKPKVGEEQDVFMKRCLGNKLMMRVYPTKQRYDICNTQWSNSEKNEHVHLFTFDEYIFENLLSKDNTYHNYKSWEDKTSSVLFICGYSGSGKSTLGKKISKDTNAIYMELDTFYNLNKDNTYKNDINSTLWKQYYQTSKYRKAFDENGLVLKKTWENPDLSGKIFEEFFMYRINYARTDNGKKYVLEGIQFAFYENQYPMFVKYPIIIMGTGLIKSSIKAGIRNNKAYKEFPDDSGETSTNLLKEFYYAFQTNLKFVEVPLKRFKMYIKRYEEKNNNDI